MTQIKGVGPVPGKRSLGAGAVIHQALAPLTEVNEISATGEVSVFRLRRST